MHQLLYLGLHHDLFHNVKVVMLPFGIDHEYRRDSCIVSADVTC